MDKPVKFTHIQVSKDCCSASCCAFVAPAVLGASFGQQHAEVPIQAILRFEAWRVPPPLAPPRV
ncbi:MAG: hypothetical protein EBQ96_09455 [Proteobacteria bacterium]|nr:hypothetical protein [Pseudomonadota bacterium]